MQPILRPTVRVILIDELDRVLMFRHKGSFRVGGVSGTSLWALPGGGLEQGEAHEAAALRELWEETGLSGASIGPCVWLRDLVFEWSGQMFDARERYHVCRVPCFEIETVHQSAIELAEMTAHRWWRIDELAVASSEVFVPTGLAHLLGPILRGAYPNDPLQLGI